METRIDKDELIKILEKNRETHASIFEEAVEGFRKKSLEQLEREIERIKAGSLTQVFVSMPEPSNHTVDYDRIIRMLELSQDDSIVLSEKDAQQYLMDDWSWKREFVATNSAYSVTAASLQQ